MAPGDAWKQKRTHDEKLNELRIALQDARVGVLVPAAPEPKAEPAPKPASQASHAELQTRRSRDGKKPKVDSNLDSDSDGEMMVVCTTDLTGEIARQGATRKTTGPKKSAGKAVKLAADASKDLGFKYCEKAGEDMALIPWKFLVCYAELYVGKTNTPLVEPYFDENQIFDNQDWDFFYLYEPEDLTANPIFFVPTFQLETLLGKINEKHHIALKIPDCAHDTFFYKFDLLQPRYYSRNALAGVPFELAVARLPLPEAEDEVIYQGATQAERDEFENTLKRIKDSLMCSKGDGKGKSKRKNAFKRYDDRKAWGHTTKRVQRYLGLRELKTAPVKPIREVLGQKEASIQGLALDLAAPAPFDPENDVVFICFDIETYERIPKLVTEIGFAILDTRDIRCIAPGEDARNWFPYIQGHHFRVKEYQNYRNKRFIKGYPQFFQFGNSQIIGIESIRKACLEVMTPKTPSGEYRKVVVVGHDVAQDIDLILTVDLDVYELPGLLEIVDNQRMQQHHKRCPNTPGLSGVLTDLEIPHLYLHNAGNDAVYTLQSMLAHSVRMRVNSLTNRGKPSSPRQRYSVPDEDAGWSTGGEDTDGGDIPPQVDPLAIAKGKVGR